MKVYTINCRARVSPDCMNGHPTIEQFGENIPMDEDGTFIDDDMGGSIVCDECYLIVMNYTPSGRGLNHELPLAIHQAKQAMKA